MEQIQHKAFGGLIKGKDEHNNVYSSGPFIRLTANPQEVVLKSLFSKIVLKKQQVSRIELVQIKKQVDDAIKIIKGVRFYHTNQDEKEYVVFTHLFPNKVLTKLKELGYEN